MIYVIMNPGFRDPEYRVPDPYLIYVVMNPGWVPKPEGDSRLHLKTENGW